MATNPNDLILVGHLTKAHGVRGEIKLFPETDNIHRLETLKKVFVGRDEQQTHTYSIQNIRTQHTKKIEIVLIKFEEITQREEAELLCNRKVFVPAKELPPLETDEYFVHDLIGLKAETEEGVAIGIVVDWLEMPAHPLFVIELPNGEERMIPDVPEFIKTINFADQKLIISPIEGMI